MMEIKFYLMIKLLIFYKDLINKIKFRFQSENFYYY